MPSGTRSVPHRGANIHSHAERGSENPLSSRIIAFMTHFHGIQCYGLRFNLSVANPLPPRRYYGSWLRDFLGQALFSGACIYSKAQCNHCALRGQCAYPQVFRPDLLADEQRLPGYVLHDWHVSPNRQSFWFSLIFIGSAVRFAEAWINHIAAYIALPDLL